MSELRRLIVRHRHVGPMVSALLASVDAAVTIRDADGAAILERGGPAGTGPAEATVRSEVAVDGDILGWVEGGRSARGVASVLAYAAARERDKRSLANEALERYRELALIYDLAAVIGGSDAVEPVVQTAVTELSRLPHDARGFVLLADGDTLRCAPGCDGEGCPVGDGRIGVGIVGEAAATGGAELVEDAAADPRATAAERAGGSLVVAALRSGDRLLGVVGATATGGPFRSADLKVVTAIAALAGPAIGRALGGARDGGAGGPGPETAS
jgi:putative methionine-R-sulfoxide reductase with GAF domain